MVRLTEDEQKMMNGDMGELKQVAIKNIVKYAEALGAEDLCDVTKATLFFGAHNYLEVVKSDDYNEIFSKMYMNCDKTLKIEEFHKNCFAQTCATPSDYFLYKELNYPKENFDKNKDYLKKIQAGGVSIVNSCTPYLTGWIPLRGEHYVTTESSNVLVCNAAFAACGNSDGLEAAVWSAVCGKTPLWGNHIMENRKGTHVVNIECPSLTELDWDIIGYAVGKKLPPHAIPVLNGNFHRPTLAKLKQCFSAMATTSGAEMCHIVGVTPEAPTLEAALGGKEPVDEVITITRADYDAGIAALCEAGGGPVDVVSLGCPHYALEEVKMVADYLKGKKVNPGVRLLVWADIPVKAMADVNGYTDIILEAGGYLVTSGCPLNAGKVLHGKMGMAFDAAKQAHYIRSEAEAKIFYGTYQQCIDAAVSGKWEA